jgi:YNFM family putative membrane transporter
MSGSGDVAYPRMAAALFLAGLVTFAQLYSIQPLLPALADSLRVPYTASPLALSLTTGTLGISLLVVGPLSEVLGRTPLIHVSLAASTVVSLLSAMAPTWSTLLVLRGVMGLALAALPVAGMAYIREEVPATAHSRAAALYVAGTAVGGMSGRLAAGVLGDLGGWRVALVGITAIGLVATICVRILLPPSRHFVPTPSNRTELMRTAARLGRDRHQLAYYGIGATFSGAFVVVYNAMAFRLVAPPYHLSLTLAGFVFVIYLVGAFSSVLAGMAGARWRSSQVMAAGGLVTVVGLVVMLGEPLLVVGLGLAVVTAGFFAVHAVASAGVAARAHDELGGTGLAVSFYLVSYYLGSAVFGGMSGAAWEAGGWLPVAVLAGSLVLVGTALSGVIARPRQG